MSGIPDTKVEDVKTDETIVAADTKVEDVKADDVKTEETSAVNDVKTDDTKIEPEKKTPWYQKRIDETTAARRAAERENEALKAKVAELEAKTTEPDADAKSDKPFTKEDVLVEAKKLLAQEEASKRTNNFLDSGFKQFGKDNFNTKCNTLASMGAGDSPEFMALITDPDIVSDGHKIVVALADNPDEAERILAFKGDPLRMGLALNKFATATLAKPVVEKKLSDAPAPIKTIDGTAKESELSDSDDIKVWMEKRNKTSRYTPTGKQR